MTATTTTDRIYLSVPHMGELEERYVQEAFRTNWLSSVGPNLDAFEQALSERLDGRSIVAVASGTAALHLVLRHAGVGTGDRVVVSTATFIGSVYPILYLGAEPVFVDSEQTSGNMDPALLAEYLRDASRAGRLPKAVMLVHLYGQHADLDPIAALCAEYGVTLIEDAAESLGSVYKGRETATTARYGALSFNGNKIITTTGGGAVVVDDPAAAATMRKWATQSREPAIEYLHRELGYNYRMSNVLAGIGRGQLPLLDTRVAQRRAVFDRYAAAFIGLPGIAMQPEAPWGTHTRWLSLMHVDATEAGLTPVDLVQRLSGLNIEARPAWRPMHTQPIFAAATSIGGAEAERLYQTTVCLPSSSSLSADAQDRVIEAVREAVLGV